MESKQLILSQRRDFGDVIGDSISFLKINFKSILNVFLTYVMPLLFLPLVLLMISGKLTELMSIYSLSSVMADDTPGDTIESMMAMLVMFGFVFLFYFLAYMVLNLTVYGTFLAYEENGNVKVTPKQIKENIKAKFGNYFISILVFIPLIIVFYIFIFIMMMIGIQIGVIGGVLMFLIVSCVSAWFFTVVYNYSWIRVREDIGISAGFERSFALIKNNWWSMFGILIVSYIIVMIGTSVFSIPFQALSFFAGMSEVGGDGDGGAGTLMLVAGLGFFIYLLGGLFLQQFLITTSIMKYYDLVEQKDGTTVGLQIDQLGESSERFFENEGEY